MQAHRYTNIKFFEYVDTIRDPNGKLRSWKDHKALSEYETQQWPRNVINASDEYLTGQEIKNREYHERSGV